MVKSKKQKKIAWIKWPVNLTDDERIAELIAQKGVAGLGAYTAIIGEMYRRQCRCLTLTQLKALKYVGATQKTVMAVVDEFGLFRKDKMGHVYSTIDYLGFLDEDENDSDADENPIGFESPSLPTPARVYKDKDEDIDKDHHHDGADVEGAVDYIGMIPQQSEWTQAALMKSGFGMLIMKHWQKTLDLFRDHTLVNLTRGSIHSVEDAKRYFHFYITNPISGGMLRKALEELDRQEKSDGEYRYEDADSCPGHRKYKGIALPDGAPPRPDERADWDFDNNCWIKF